MDEIWNNNLVNLFSTPLKITEWLTSVVGLSFIKTLVSLAVITPVMFFLYSVNVLMLGRWLPVLFLSATMTGWWIGLIASSFVLRYGPRVQTVIWSLPAVLLPFSAIYFPVDRLPGPMQSIAWLLPSTYVLETMRGILLEGVVNYDYIAISFVLNIIYLGLSTVFFLKSFKFSLKLGLNRFI